jgi:hypothetical protein
MLRVDAENPPNKRQIEERLNTALAELIGLVARHNELKNNKMTLGADHINNGGAGDGTGVELELLDAAWTQQQNSLSVFFLLFFLRILVSFLSESNI